MSQADYSAEESYCNFFFRIPYCKMQEQYLLIKFLFDNIDILVSINKKLLNANPKKAS